MRVEDAAETKYRATGIAPSAGASGNSSSQGNYLQDNNKSGIKLLTNEDPNDSVKPLPGSSCARACTASGAKRFLIYRRDYCGLICHIVIPVILIIFGLWLASGPSKLTQSPPRYFSTSWYPIKQRILMNKTPVNHTYTDS